MTVPAALPIASSEQVKRRQLAIAIDEDPRHYAAEGLIGLQMHTGPPFKLEYRNVLYKKIQ